MGVGPRAEIDAIATIVHASVVNDSTMCPCMLIRAQYRER